MPKFNDSENQAPIQPDGDYIFRVIEFSSGISAGSKTRGSDDYKLTLELEPSGAKVNERLIDHPSCDWKIDTFLKSAGVQIAKGAAFEFQENRAIASGVPFINPIGLRGWCRIHTETYAKKGEPAEDKGKWTGKSNKVAIFYTDKPKLPRIDPPVEADPFAAEDGGPY